MLQLVELRLDALMHAGTLGSITDLFGQRQEIGTG